MFQWTFASCTCAHISFGYIHLVVEQLDDMIYVYATPVDNAKLYLKVNWTIHGHYRREFLLFYHYFAHF